MTVDLKKVLILNLPYLLFVYLFDKLCQAVRLAPGLDASEKFLHLSQGFTEAFSSGLPSLHPLDLLVGIAGAVIVRLAVYAKGKNARKYRKGIEYGSARWGTGADIAPYVDPVPDWNIPLTQTEKLTMSSRPKNPKHARNKNILVIGGSLGSVKVNQAVRSILPRLLEKFQVIHICGKGNLDESLIGTAGYVQYEYVDSPLKHLFAAADLIVSRAGANSICEILALRKPNVLIPLSAAASRGDQILNARSFAGQGFSEVLEEEQMTDDTLLNAITDTYENRRKFVEAMEKSHLNNAVHTIMELIQAVQ